MSTETKSSAPGALRGARAPGPMARLHHAARVTSDAARICDFYERVLGMEMVHVVVDDRVPSTGQPFPYIHLFFAMADGSTVAFFESPSLPPRAPSSHPGFDVFDHFAMAVDSRAAVDAWHAWLTSQGVEVVGPTDHGIIYSIYFHDPDGSRLEITTDLDTTWAAHPEQARRQLDAWNATKEQARRSGADVNRALIDLIKAGAGSHS